MLSTIDAGDGGLQIEKQLFIHIAPRQRTADMHIGQVLEGGRDRDEVVFIDGEMQQHFMHLPLPVPDIIRAKTQPEIANGFLDLIDPIIKSKMGQALVRMQQLERHLRLERQGGMLCHQTIVAAVFQSEVIVMRDGVDDVHHAGLGEIRRQVKLARATRGSGLGHGLPAARAFIALREAVRQGCGPLGNR